MSEIKLDSSMKTVAQGGFGAKLARAREERQWSTAQVAEQLKLTARQIEALEAEDFSRLPGPVFVRGFIRNYARLLELDPEELLAATDVRQAPTETITAPSEGVRLGRSSLRSWLLLPLLLFGLFLLMVSGMYYWLRQGESTLLESPPVNASLGTAAPMPQDAPPALPSMPEPSPAAPTQESAAPSQTVVPPVLPPAPQVEAPPLAPPVAPEPAPPPNGRAVLRFQAQEDAWIRVDDRDGQRYSKLLRAGTSELVHGNPPFRLVVGNAASVRLEYNQQSIDLKPFIGEKVARLTLE